MKSEYDCLRNTYPIGSRIVLDEKVIATNGADLS